MAKIDGLVVALPPPPKNQFREPKKITYMVPIYKPRTPSWSSCEYSLNLSIEMEVVYPWEINITISHMSDVQEQKLA